MSIVFAPLLAAFSRFKPHAVDTSRSLSLAESDVVTMPALGVGERQHGRARNSKIYKVQATQHYTPKVHQSSVSTGLSNSKYERLDGVVTIDIHPNRLGQIKFAGGWWSAKCGRSIILKAGTLVKVLGRDNIILIVEPMGAHPHF